MSGYLLIHKFVKLQQIASLCQKNNEQFSTAKIIYANVTAIDLRSLERASLFGRIDRTDGLRGGIDAELYILRVCRFVMTAPAYSH
jgi:hypothetical protein